ncbi:MAG: T9SS type A sorting domain-containing protein [Gemmatimonadota bacterium]|nr:MAG: T9SS type A sorting domain-containing protein [Gemmatimonadota bacterium]
MRDWKIKMFMTRRFWSICMLIMCSMCCGWGWQDSNADTSESVVDTGKVRIPNVWAMPGDTIELPIIILYDVTGLDIFSITGDLTFDPSLISLTGDTVITEGTPSDNEVWAWFFISAMVDTNTFRMVWAAVESLEGSGPLVYVQFRVSPMAQLGEVSPLWLESWNFNEGDPAIEVFDGVFSVGQPPRIELSETIHEYGTVDIGQSAEWILRITNVGDNFLDIYTMETDSVQFEVLEPFFPQSINAGNTIETTVTFTPDSNDSIEGNLRLSCNDLDNLILNIPLGGIGRGTHVQLLSFTAQFHDDKIFINWITSEESCHLGFILYRSCFPDKDFKPINTELIAGGPSYVFLDDSPKGEGIHYYKLSSVDVNGYEETVGFTSVKVFSMTPTTHSLLQNYPNPFNPITYITFEAPKEEYVTLSVYNCLGQEIRKLFEGHADLNHNTVSWDGLDSKGNILPSGIYFCRLQSSMGIRSMRMMLLR